LFAAGFFRGKTKIASLTLRSPSLSEGLLTIFPFKNIVVEPPPSRFIASVAPSSTSSAASSFKFIPTLSFCRPSTVIIKIFPSLRRATAVRGWRVSTNDFEDFSCSHVISILPFLTSCGTPPIISSAK
jgi:hypothetical protein